MTGTHTETTKAQKMNQLKGYVCIKILIAIRLNRLKGLMMYNEGVALKRKIVFCLFRTINVCGEKEGETEKYTKNKLYSTYSVHCFPLKLQG